MQKEFQKITSANKVYTVRLIKAFDAKGDPFSAFIIFDQVDFDKFPSDEVVDLKQYRENILLMKRGHSVTQKDEQDVRELINRYYLKETTSTEDQADSVHEQSPSTGWTE